MGKYHGKRGFEAFSNEKSVLWRSLRMDWISDAMRYPPITEKKAKNAGTGVFSRPSSRHFRPKDGEGIGLCTISCILASLGTFAAIAATYYFRMNPN